MVSPLFHSISNEIVSNLPQNEISLFVKMSNKVTVVAPHSIRRVIRFDHPCKGLQMSVGLIMKINKYNPLLDILTKGCVSG